MKRAPNKCFKPEEVCITCEQTKPCTYHGIRRGFVCSDCWVWADVPEHIKRAVALRNQQKPRRSKKDLFKRPADQPPAHHYLEVQQTRRDPGKPPPAHPDAL